MRLSTRGQYGVKAMFQLAKNYGQGTLPLKEVAARGNISEGYLEQLFSDLRKNKLIKSIRGAQGGYSLAKPPKEINLGMILDAVEGPLSFSDCSDEGEYQGCEGSDFCPTRSTWFKIRESLNEILAAYTLADILAEEEELLEKKKQGLPGVSGLMKCRGGKDDEQNLS